MCLSKKNQHTGYRRKTQIKGQPARNREAPIDLRKL
jgi:hypothetical protein